MSFFADSGYSSRTPLSFFQSKSGFCRRPTFALILLPSFLLASDYSGNTIRAKVGLNKKPDLDWKKDRGVREEYPESAKKDMEKMADKRDKTWWKDQDKAMSKKKKNKRGRSFRPSY
jgi:hypothetical protein